MRLVLNYKLPDGWCGSTARIDHADYLETPLMLSPVRGSWYFGNGMTQIRVQSSPLPRALQLRPYAARREWRDLRRADDDNDSFFCYSEEIHAMADGVVLGYRNS